MSGAGFGNKTANEPSIEEADNSYRFGKHTKGGAYQNAHERYGSGQPSPLWFSTPSLH
jgi:hypothetical protein